MRIGLFVTCLTDTLFPETGKAVVAVLERLGHQVDFPAAQACCGQMHFNTGYRREAVPMVRGFAAAFGGFEAIVTPSASCASMVREYFAVLAAEAGDPGLARAVAEVAPRTHELSVFLTGVLGVTDVGAYFPHRVTYHPSCHSLRMLRVGDAPLRLLRAVRGLDLADLPDAEACCGFGGTFAVKNADVSAAICADKVTAVRQSGAEVLCAADNSCLMHIGGALKRQRSGVAVMHLAEILARTEDSPVTPPGAGGPHRRSRIPDLGAPHPDADLSGHAVLPGRGENRGGRFPAARQPGRTPRARSAPSGPARSPNWPTGSSCARPPRRSRTTPWPTWTPTCSGWRPTSPGRAATCTGRPTPPRRTRSWPAWSGRPAPTAWSR